MRSVSVVVVLTIVGDDGTMEKSKAIFISARVIFAISMVIFMLSLFTEFVDRYVFGGIASAMAIIAIIMIYIGLYIKVKENHAKEEE